MMVIAALVLFWVMPWPQMELGVDAKGSPVYEALTGAERTGAAGALSLLAVWGLAATALAAGSLRALRIGFALTECVVALGVTALLFVEHPWIPGGEIREAWGAIFGPLAILALLDAVTLYQGAVSSPTLSVIRAGSALFAAGCLAVSLAWIPAGVALWLALSPLAFLKVERVQTGRRVVEVLLLLTAVAHGFSLHVQAAFVSVGRPTGGELNLPLMAWGVLTAIVAVTALDGLLRAEEDQPGVANPD